MKKIQNILLIDDDFPTNYLHEIYLKDSGLVENVHSKLDTDEAIEFLKIAHEEDRSPELIFIDINLPGKDGFDFINDFDMLDEAIKTKSKVIMCSTSNNPKDVAKTKSYSTIQEIITKPLTAEKFIPLAEKYLG